MTIAIDGRGLTCADVHAVACAEAKVEVTEAGLDQARAAHLVVTRALAGGARVYGRTTGVGANRGVHAPNTMGNFCFEVTLSYRRLEKPRRVLSGL